jgi:hypothetical protein
MLKRKPKENKEVSLSIERQNESPIYRPLLDDNAT